MGKFAICCGIMALSVLTAGCVGGLLDPGRIGPGPIDHRTAVQRTMDTLSRDTGASSMGCHGISTAFHITCNLSRLDGERFEDYLVRAGWARTPSDAARQGFYRDGILVSYEKRDWMLAVTVSKH
jgi:hypothetical protein